MSGLLKSFNSVLNIAFFSFFFPKVVSLLKSTPANKFNSFVPFNLLMVSRALLINSPIFSASLWSYK